MRASTPPNNSAVSQNAAETLTERLRFIGIDPATRSTLQKLKPLLEAELPGILDGFYAHIAGFPTVARLFGEPSRREGAKSAQITHWRTILSGDFGPAYVESVRRIGATHARIGLEPRWYIAGYSFIAERVVALLNARSVGAMGLRKEDPQPLIAAFMKAMLLDMDFALSIYVEESENARRQMADELAARLDAGVGAIVATVASAA
jgi:hypothetical protein